LDASFPSGAKARLSLRRCGRAKARLFQGRDGGDDNGGEVGTDGWRGIIADDFTLCQCARAARAIAALRLKHEDAKRGVCIGYDTRFGSRHFAGVAAEGWPTREFGGACSEIAPTPALSYAVAGARRRVAVMITSATILRSGTE